MDKFEIAIQAAQSLKSEHGENPEYDRALVELIADTFGAELAPMVPQDADFDEVKRHVANLIQIKEN